MVKKIGEFRYGTPSEREECRAAFDAAEDQDMVVLLDDKAPGDPFGIVKAALPPNGMYPDGRFCLDVVHPSAPGWEERYEAMRLERLRRLSPDWVAPAEKTPREAELEGRLARALRLADDAISGRMAESLEKADLRRKLERMEKMYHWEKKLGSILVTTLLILGAVLTAVLGARR